MSTPERRRPSQSSSRPVGEAPRKKKKKKKHLFSKKTRKMLKRNSFKIFLAVYTLVLIILGAIFLGYTDKCLIQYENSQSVYVAEKFCEDFKAAVATGNLPETVDMSSFAGPFDSVESVKAMFMGNITGKEISFEKKSDSYNTEMPSYVILAGGEPVLEYSYTAVNPRTIFGILTIMDWQLTEVKPVLSLAGENLLIEAPSTYTVQVNGITLDDSYLKTEACAYDEFLYASEYVSLPLKKTYEVSGLKFDPTVVITDESGNQVNYASRDENGENGSYTVYSATFLTTDIPTEYYDRALSMVKTWNLFMSDSLSGSLHGFDSVAAVLIKDSYYYQKAHEYATSVDITFTSAHVLDSEPYTGVVVDEFVQYSDTCFSCHVAFVINMTLTRNGDKATIDVDSTYTFVYYDDSDDGVDNPHWAIVDMVANTAN